MDQLYSVTLLIALAAASVATLCGVLNLHHSTTGRRTVGTVASVVALVVGGLSFVVHLRVGHGPKSPEPMALERFLQIHPAYGVVLALSLIGIGARLARRRR